MAASNAMDTDAWAGFLGRKWAKNWQSTDRTFDGLTERMVAIAEESPFRNVLDVGCGAGELVLKMAAMHPQAQFTGIDISDELIGEAAARAGGAGNVHFACADARSWLPEPEVGFDLLLARHVVMFFDDPVTTLAHLASLADEGGRLVFSCFRTNEENGWIGNILSQLPGTPAPRIARGKPSPLAFADPQWVEQTLLASGWRDVRAEAFDYPMVMGEGEDAIEEALGYLLEIGPASFAASGMAPNELADFKQRMREMLAGYLDDGQVALPAATWLVSARRS